MDLGGLSYVGNFLNFALPSKKLMVTVIKSVEYRQKRTIHPSIKRNILKMDSNQVCDDLDLRIRIHGKMVN